MKNAKQTTLAVVLACSLFSTLFAQDFKTQSVAVFKNGQSFFIKYGKVKTDKSTYRVKEGDVPASLFGSLWFSSPSDNLAFVKSFPDSTEEKRNVAVQAFQDLMAINKGKKMKVYLGDNRTYDGVIESMDEGRPGPARLGSLNSLVTMKTSTGAWVSFYSAQVTQIEFLEKPALSKELLEKLPQNVVEISFADTKSDQELNMMYLRNGLNWAPQYLLELQSKTEATLTLQAELSNEAEDLDNVALDLVVGVPNFRYADRLSFLVDFMKSMPYPDTRFAQQMSNSLATQTINYGINADAETSPISTSPVEGSSNEDLFFYHLKNFSLKKGGRAMQRIFNEKITIAHVYEANLPDNGNPNFQQDFLFSPDEENKVFHTVRINNKTNQPWTTGSVFVVNQEAGARPISQDMLTYTSAGGHSFVKLTEAPDIRIKQAERETSRKERARQYPNTGYWYDLVKVEGKIEIRNFKKEKIALNVRRTISGQLGETSVPWLTQETINNRDMLNKATNVCWETSLDADGKLEIVYSYEVYVRG
ncbi:MAG: hypothetical protein R2830_01195 [Saprospiraceae bacterium]